jgi:hypothetical protein
LSGVGRRRLVPRHLVAAFVAALLALPLMPILAAERTAVFQANLTIPITGERAIGTLTITYDDESGNGTWSFLGTLEGEPASASGDGTVIVRENAAGETVLSLTMTAVDAWVVPGIDEHVPRSATVRMAGSLAYVNYDGPVFDLFGIPVAIEPRLSIPVEGVYVLSDPSSGDQVVTEIPATGVGPGSSGSLPHIALVALIATTGAALACLVAGVPRRRSAVRVRVRK